MAIEIVGEKTKPRIICPHCKQQIAIDIRDFADDITKVMRDKCPKCNNEIFVAVLILSHRNHYALLQQIKLVANTLEGPGRLLL